MEYLDFINQRYILAGKFADPDTKNYRVEMHIVGDKAGTQYSSAVWQLIRSTMEDDGDLWNDLIRRVKLIRSRRLTQPQPKDPDSHALIEEALQEVDRYESMVTEPELLENVRAGLEAIRIKESPLATTVWENIEEIGTDDCIVVADNGKAKIALQRWLEPLAARVFTPGDLERKGQFFEQLYVVGPPRFFRSSLTTAPLAENIAYLIPNWFGDLRLPQSRISEYAENSVEPSIWCFSITGDLEPESAVSESTLGAENDHEADQLQGREEILLPQPVWKLPPSEERSPETHEKYARKVLLSGNQAIWLEDEGYIRVLDPDQPTHERVSRIDVQTVREGTHLLLGDGTSSSDELLELAYAEMEDQGEAIRQSQERWKSQLRRLLKSYGQEQAIIHLKNQGMSNPERVPQWVVPSYRRPHSDDDFKVLLARLEVPVSETIELANELRSKVALVRASLTRELEYAAANADYASLERDGFLRLRLAPHDAREIVIAQVLAISPERRIVKKTDLRTLFSDDGAFWLL